MLCVTFLPKWMNHENIVINAIFSLVPFHRAAQLLVAEVKKKTGKTEHCTILLIEPKPKIPGLTQLSGKIKKTVPIGLQDIKDNRSPPNKTKRLSGNGQLSEMLAKTLP